MEIEARFPTIQATQPLEARDGANQTSPPAALVGPGSESEFFISPVLRFDSRSLTVIFQVRDSRSGDVVRQFPPEAVVERYRQDPSAKPFVLFASGPGDGTDAEDPALLAPLLPDGEAPEAPEAQEVESESTADPVDLVA